jgi:hypothetical protein
MQGQFNNATCHVVQMFEKLDTKDCAIHMFKWEGWWTCVKFSSIQKKYQTTIIPN